MSGKEKHDAEHRQGSLPFRLESCALLQSWRPQVVDLVAPINYDAILILAREYSRGYSSLSSHSTKRRIQHVQRSSSKIDHWAAAELSLEYSGSHLFYAKLWTVADQKPMVKKIWKNMKNYGMVCPPPQNQKEGKNPSRSYHNHLPPFFGDFGGVSTSNVPSYEWSSWQLRTRRAASVRMFDHKRERCTVCSQCAPLRWTSHPFSLMKTLQNRCHTPASLFQCMTRIWAIHWSFPAQGTWHRTGFADQAPGQGMCHTHTLIRVPWAGYEQCTLARVQEMVHTLSRVWTVHPGQGMSIAHSYPDMGILLFPGQDDFLQFIIFWLILVCTLTHSCSLPRVPCIPYIPCPGFHGYPAQGSTHTLPCVLCIPYLGFHAHPAHGTTQAYLSHSTP